VPFSPGSRGGDHFPDHLLRDASPYGNGQIAAAALWEARVGMRSKHGAVGTAEFGARFLAALRAAGFHAPPTGAPVVARIYHLLYVLALEMAGQWAGDDTMNKVTSGFARVGIFLIPYQCLDGDPATRDETACPTGENGGDAVVDIDDGDLADDPIVNGVTHPDRDFLQRGGRPPILHVWSGARYLLTGTTGTQPTPPPCNGEYQVELSASPDFPADPASTIASGWLPVGAGGAPPCYAAWSPDTSAWTTLQQRATSARIFYRARTRQAGGGNERISTQPGQLWTVPPPFAVLTDTGQPDD
jgi:hypothetical protein